jgi:PRTRC genetic system ThiF family protein
MGHPGLDVKIVDPDKVSEANIGRQLFTTGEIGIHKSIAIANRINRTFGFRWQGYPMKWTKRCTANITITCVDSVKTRVHIHKHLVNNKSNAEKFGFTFASRSFYWIDTGNDYDFGQIILGTTRRWKQLQKRLSYIPNVFDLHPEFKDAKSDSRPSCSIAMALSKQDLFINTMIADYTGQMVWKMLTKPFIDYHAVYLNLGTMKVNTRKI